MNSLKNKISISSLCDKFFESEVFQKISFVGEKNIFVKNLSGSLLSFLAVYINKKYNVPVLVVSTNIERAKTIKDDVQIISNDKNIFLFSFDSFHSSKIVDHSLEIFRNESLDALLNNRAKIISTHISALTKSLPSPKSSLEKFISIKINNDFSFTFLIEKLNEIGFVQKKFVEELGDFSIRGGIVDVFPFNSEEPIRIEFYGDMVESIRKFDVATQRSILMLDEISISPNFSSREIDEENKSSFFDFISADTIIITDEFDLLAKEIDELLSEGISLDFNLGEIKNKIIDFSTITNLSLGHSENEIDFSSLAQPSCGGSVKIFAQEILKLIEKNYSVFVSAASQDETERIKDLLEQVENFPIEKIVFINESLHFGFSFSHLQIAIFTEHEIFDRIKRHHSQIKNKFQGLSNKEFRSLDYGDFIVHVDHGIGKYLGLSKIKIKNHEQEAAKIEYADEGILFVNLNFINRIQKYSSSQSHTPSLNKIGAPDWARLQQKTKKKIKDIARELIKLYAKRKMEDGFSSTPDTAWQKELEASFEFDDTPDQTRATQEIKIDMESASPMDRLVCGDVGFGKTEVALRAAFKSVMSGKQVAVLVPTTILAEQHHQTFNKRLKNYSVCVEVVSRFQSPKKVKEILIALKNKQVDILIGTHRLLSKDVEFADLGLLIIDEEHRFGVSAKEKLRSLKTNVDTLALTATPIPRTLQFSLLGSRDLSIINTPPKNRLPIHTEIVEFNQQIIRESILREIHRGGQVFIVNDKIETLDKLARIIEQHLPEVKFKIAHGQLKSHELESVMMDFLNKKFSVMITTKIIESGLDITNANTIIINRADRFGMAELHQLRGRVGRSNTQAFAYLLTPPISILPKGTVNRLQMLAQYTELGSGFTLAMRDLEIRGAGNLLGAEQSGFIFELGFEMYEKILDETVRELKNEEFQHLTDKIKKENNIETTIEADVDAYIPEIYVSDETERLDIYRRIMGANSAEALGLIFDELIDRFGATLPEVENLFSLAELKIIGNKIGLRKIEIENNNLKLYLPPQTDNEFYESGQFQKIMDVVNEKFSKTLRLQQQRDKLFIVGAVLSVSELEKLSEVKKVLLGF